MKSSSLNSLSIGSCWLPRPVSSTYPALGEDCRSGASLASLALCLSHAASFLPSSSLPSTSSILGESGVSVTPVRRLLVYKTTS